MRWVKRRRLSRSNIPAAEIVKVDRHTAEVEEWVENCIFSITADALLADKG
jgi:hypothetical protein